MTTTMRTGSGIKFAELGARLSSAMSAAGGGSSQVCHRSGVLVVLDLHGVLVERIGSKDKARMRCAREQRNRWRVLRKRSVWLRPYLHQFLEFATARHDVAVWSSAQPETISELLKNVSKHFGMERSLQEKLCFIWDRRKCKPDLRKGGYATLKYLKDLWECPAFEDRYSCKNTLLLDDSADKFRDFPTSGIEIPEYRADILRDRYNNDDTLLWLLLYIEYLLKESYARSEIPGLFNISTSRAACMNLEDFILAGELEARRITNNRQRKQLKSLALVFIRELAHKEETKAPNGESASTLLQPVL